MPNSTGNHPCHRRPCVSTLGGILPGIDTNHALIIEVVTHHDIRDGIAGFYRCRNAVMPGTNLDGAIGEFSADDPTPEPIFFYGGFEAIHHRLIHRVHAKISRWVWLQGP